MSSKTSNREATPTASNPTPVPPVPQEDQASYDEKRQWREPPWGDTYWCEMCSTCMRWRHSQRARGRVCVTSFNFNFPMVIIEQGRCNEYRPVPGAEGLWTDDYLEEDEEYEARRREGENSGTYDEEGGDARRSARTGQARRRPRRRSRRSTGGAAGTV